MSTNPIAVFEGYIGGQPVIAWRGEPLPAGAEFYAAPVQAQAQNRALELFAKNRLGLDPDGETYKRLMALVAPVQAQPVASDLRATVEDLADRLRTIRMLDRFHEISVACGNAISLAEAALAATQPAVAPAAPQPFNTATQEQIAGLKLLAECRRHNAAVDAAAPVPAQGEREAIPTWQERMGGAWVEMGSRAPACNRTEQCMVAEIADLRAALAAKVQPVKPYEQRMTDNDDECLGDALSAMQAEINDWRSLAASPAKPANQAVEEPITEAMIQAGIAALSLTAKTAPNAEIAVSMLYRAMVDARVGGA